MFNFIYKVVKTSRISYIFMNFLYSIEPLFYPRRMQRMPLWLPDEQMKTVTPFYQIFYLFEVGFIWSCDFAILHFDLIIVLLVGAAYIQLEMIKYRLITVGNSPNKIETVKDCVCHQNLIYFYLNKLESTFSMIMLLQVMTYIMATCLPAYLFTSTR